MDTYLSQSNFRRVSTDRLNRVVNQLVASLGDELLFIVRPYDHTDGPQAAPLAIDKNKNNSVLGRI